jgi:hypothetical protein
MGKAVIMVMIVMRENGLLHAESSLRGSFGLCATGCGGIADCYGLLRGEAPAFRYQSRMARTEVFPEVMICYATLHEMGDRTCCDADSQF